jgi:hypothetical protein
MVHCLHVLNPLARKPLADLERRDNSRAGALRDLNHISDVIAVAMRDENEIGSDLFRIDLFRERIGGDEWIKKQCFPASDDGETGVSIIGKFHDIYLAVKVGQRNWPGTVASRR